MTADAGFITYFVLGLGLDGNAVQSVMFNIRLARINPLGLFSWLKARLAIFGWELDEDYSSEFHCELVREAGAVSLAFGLEQANNDPESLRFFLIKSDLLNPDGPEAHILSSTQCALGNWLPIDVEDNFISTKIFDSKFEFLTSITETMVG